jgi:outer membrane autotransporter protein
MSYTERMTIASDMVATGLSLGVRVGDVLVVPGDTPGSVRFERVTIDAPASLTVGTGATVEAGTLTGAAGSRVSIATGGVLGVGDGSSIDGLEGGGSLQVAGNVTINGDAPDFTGAIELALASVLTLHVGNGTMSGTFAGDGNVIVEADGTLRATTGFGTTLTGTITIRSGGLESELVDMPGTWDVQQDGTLVFQPLLPLGRDESYLGGSLQGTGAVAMAGEGTLVVQSDQILSPDLALEVRSGGLRIEASEPGAVSAFSRVSIVGGAELEVGEDTTVVVGGLDGAVGSLISVDEGGMLDLNGDCSHAGEIAGAGSLELGCSLTLDADSPEFVGRVEIRPEGMLTINGITGRRGSGDDLDRLVTDTVVRGGVLAGVGLWLGNALAESGGTVAPGNSIGTLSVGAITFAPGSIFEVEVDGAGNSDLLAVSDAATLDGGTVRVLAENGTDDGSTYALETEYTILTAGDGITGTFDEVTEDFPFLSAALTYEANAVTLVLTRDGLADFCLGGATANQCATGEGVESLGSGPLFVAVLVLSEGDALRAFDALSGEIHASARTALLEDSRFPREAALARMRGAFHAPGGSPDIAERRVSDRLSFWGQGFGAWGDWDGDGNAARLDRSVGGFTMGGDAQVGETMRIGLFGGYSEGSFGVNDRASSASLDSLHLGAYGGGQWGEFGLRVGGAYGWHDLETGRSVQFGGFAGSLSADYEAHTLQGFAEAGLRLDVGAATLEPFGGLAHVTVRSDAFTEAGGAAALTVARRTTGATFTTLGLRAETRAGLGEANVRLSAMLGWRHAFGDLASGAHRFAAGGTGFSAAGVPLADDTVAVEAGLDLTITPAVTFGIGYSGQFGRGVSDSGVQARVGIRF